MAGQFVKNAWYLAAWSSEVTDGLLARRILDEPIVLFRRRDGTPAALIDRCPHKLAPLSLGKRLGDEVQCGYHGLQFDGEGRCTRVPGQTQIPQTAHTRSFPLIEKYGALWIWMGDKALACESKLVELRHFREKGWSTVSDQYLNFKCNYLIITDNLVDPAHTTYVHAATIGSPDGADVPVTVEHSDTHVLAYRWIRNVPPVPLAKAMGTFSDSTDRYQYYHLYLPSISCVDFGTMESGQEPTEAAKDASLRSFSYNFLTPETADRTHYFWMHMRNYKVDDPAADSDVVRLMQATFLEDAEILAAVQEQQRETGVREFARLVIDNAPSRVRRLTDQMIAAEQAREPAMA